MGKESKFTKDSEGYTAVRVVSSTESLPATDKDWMFGRDTNGNIAVRVIGSMGSNNVIIKTTEIPEASEEEYGKMRIYDGETNSIYTHGYVYECKAQTTTESLILFDPVGIGKLSFDYTNHSVYDLFERISEIETTFNAEDVVRGSFRLDKTNEIWYISGYDIDGNALFENFTVGATGDEYCLDEYGYVYTFQFPDDYEEGHTENFRIVKDSHSDYYWERINVQPITGEALGVNFDSSKTQVLKNINGIITWVDE